MEQIEADRTFRLAQTYMQDIITETKNANHLAHKYLDIDKIVEMYNSLTLDNAKEMYDLAHDMMGRAINTGSREFDWSIIKGLSSGIAVGLLTFGITIFLQYCFSSYISKYGYVDKALDITKNISIGIVAISFIGMFAVGH